MRKWRVFAVGAVMLCTGLALAAGPAQQASTTNVEPADADLALMEKAALADQAQAAPVSTAELTPFAGNKVATMPSMAAQRAVVSNVQRDCPDATIMINIFTDNYPTETTWEVTDQASGTVICSGGPYDTPATLYEEECCVAADGCYNFTIFDAYGDGICCSYGDGYYEVYYEGTLVGSGGSFGDSETVGFIGGGCGEPEYACCVEGVCVGETTEDVCLAQGGSWFQGQSCATVFCPVAWCPSNTLVGHGLDSPDDAWSFGTSDQGATEAYLIYENFSGVAGAICDVHFWGLNLYNDGSSWAPCTEDPMTFEITFYEDNAGEPGAVACSYTVDLSPTPTGILYADTYEALYYETMLSPCCSLANGWVSIQGAGDPNCWFLWASSPEGDGSSLQWDGTALVDTGRDRAVCLTGELQPGACCDPFTATCTDGVDFENCDPAFQFYPGVLCDDLDPPCGGIPGACCDDVTGTCVEDVLPANCDGRFLAGGLCTDFDPPCGQLVGACCLPDCTCDMISEADCATAGGLYIGDLVPCDPDPCPCCIPCEPNEGEEVCYPEYDDTYNPGCNGTPPVFQDIGDIGDAGAIDICGTSGVYPFGGSDYRDMDWFSFTLTEQCTVHLELYAEYPAAMWLLLDGPVCPVGEYLFNSATEPCTTIVIDSECLNAGEYAVIVSPADWGDYPCGAKYEFSMTAASCYIPVGACCIQTGECIPDQSEAQCLAVDGQWQGEDTVCDPNPCEPWTCTPCFSNATDDWIDVVVFNTINNGPTGPEGEPCNYGDYTGMSTLVVPGVTYDLEVTVGVNGTWTEHVSAWFDWNQNLVYEEAERYYLGSFAGTNTFVLPITIPTDAALGATTFRVIERWNAEPVDPCEEYSFGEAEDYGLEIGTGEPGACCDDATGTCVDGVLPADCDGRFAMGVLCDDLDPPCGQMWGACCLPDCTCDEVGEAECVAAGGLYMGDLIPCDPDPCPCCINCEPNEGEEVCYPEYDDTYNPGCNGTPPVFQDIGDIGDAGAIDICGTSGVYPFGGSDYRDMDWFSFTLTEQCTVHLELYAEYPAAMWLMLDGPVCPVGETLFVNATEPCTTLVIDSECLNAGEYAVIVSPADWGDYPCGSLYEFSMTATSCYVPTGACCIQTGECIPDQSEAQCLAVSGQWQGEDTVCDPNPCEPWTCTPCYSDLDDDFITNVTFNTINNDTGPEGAPCSYGDYTSMSTDVSTGVEYELSVSLDGNGTWTQYVSAWFDWNQNLVYEASEYYEIGSVALTPGTPVTVSAMIMVPVDALGGDTTFRVIERYSTYSVDPCEEYTYGEAEDYGLLVLALCGDLDQDADVDVADYWLFLDAFGTCEGDVKYREDADFDEDGCITLVDFQAWLQCFYDANGFTFRPPNGGPRPIDSGTVIRPTLIER